MDIESLRAYCLDKKGATESMPFGDKTLVFKVMNKMFALASLDTVPLRINLKCDPDKAVELREAHDQVQPGYHMNKQHWNTVILDGGLPQPFVHELIDHSFDLIIQGLPKKVKSTFDDL